MQLKSIRKNIARKMDEWIASIDDDQLRKDVEKHLLVTGGCIVSLLGNQKVNDYDVYLQDIDTLVRLARYYVVKTGCKDVVKVLDGRNKTALVESIPEFHDGDENVNKSAYAVCVRNLKEDSVKLFLESKNGGYKVNEDKKLEELKYDPLFFSPNAISLSNQIQIVLRFSGDVDKIHDTFDFVHATNYYTTKDGLVTNKTALESIITKQLKYQGSHYPVTSIVRVKKFLQRGWKIGAGEMLKIMFQISELDLKNPDVLEEQLIGVDVAYFARLIEALRGVDPNKITSDYINAIIDRVFDESEEEEDQPVSE